MTDQNPENQTCASPTVVSIVVPVYAGSKYLDALTAAIDNLRSQWESGDAPVTLGEVIFVEDAAIDSSATVVDRLAAERPWVTALHLSRNFGQHAATMVGILHSSGDWVVTMDEDLQHRPDRVPELLALAVSKGADIVYAKPNSGVHDAAMRDLTSRSFKRLMQWITGNPNLSNFNSFRLIRGPIARAAASVCTHDTYLDIGLSWFTQRIETISLEMKDERFIRTGKSGYSFRALLSHAWRMMFSSQIKLLRIGSLIGLAAMLLSVLGGVYVLVKKLIHPELIEVQGWASLILAIVFFGGLTAFMLGIALQYLSTLVLKAHGKPTFFTVDRSGDAALAKRLSQFET